MVEFDPSSYTVIEGGERQIRIVARGDFTSAISVSFSTRDGTATGKIIYINRVSIKLLQ